MATPLKGRLSGSRPFLFSRLLPEYIRSEIRNPNLEIRNKNEIRNSKIIDGLGFLCSDSFRIFEIRILKEGQRLNDTIHSHSQRRAAFREAAPGQLLRRRQAAHRPAR